VEVIADQVSPFRTKYPTLKKIPSHEEHPQLHLDDACKAHIELFERAMGMEVNAFMGMNNRLHHALSVTAPVNIGPPEFVDGGLYSWLDLVSGFVGIGSDIWPSTDFEEDVATFLDDLIHEWVERGCWCAEESDEYRVTYLKWYDELIEGASQYQWLQVPLLVTR